METTTWILAVLFALAIGFALGRRRKIEVGYLAEPLKREKTNIKVEKKEKCWKRFCDREATTHDGLCQSCKDREYGF